jgi:hypothetical protein
LRRHLAELAGALKEGRPILGKARPPRQCSLRSTNEETSHQPSIVKRKAALVGPANSQPMI